MAFPTAVNDQVTDSVTQSGVSTLSNAPAVAISNLMIATAHALATAAHNATHAQQQNYILAQAATTQGVAKLLSIFGEDASDINEILKPAPPAAKPATGK